jgi:hypothetical protein
LGDELAYFYGLIGSSPFSPTRRLPIFSQTKPVLRDLWNIREQLSSTAKPSLIPGDAFQNENSKRGRAIFLTPISLENFYPKNAAQKHTITSGPQELRWLLNAEKIKISELLKRSRIPTRSQLIAG